MKTYLFNLLIWFVAFVEIAHASCMIFSSRKLPAISVSVGPLEYIAADAPILTQTTARMMSFAEIDALNLPTGEHNLLVFEQAGFQKVREPCFEE